MTDKQEHSVTIEQVDGKHKWVCACGAEGNQHEDRGMAWAFGIEHNWNMRPYVRVQA